MNKLILIAVVATFLTLFSIQSADAAIFDWINLSKSSDSKIALPSQDKSLSFDAIYNSIQRIGLGVSQNKSEVTETNSVSVIETSNPSTTRKAKAIARTYKVTATAYSSTPDQTDDSPFITANGSYVRDGIIATNFLPFGTAVKIPALYGDKIFIVEDRMNRRYTDRIDVWFAERQTAKNFGIKKVTIEVVS